MVWLQSKQRFNNVVRYDVTTKIRHEYVRTNANIEIPPETDGSYAMLSGMFVAIFRLKQELVICAGDVQLPLSSEVTINVSGDRCNRELRIFSGDSLVLDHGYSLENEEVFVNDPTPFIDDEDFDFGLFLANVASSPERQNVMKRLA